MNTPKVVSWKQARNFTKFYHLTRDDINTFCGARIGPNVNELFAGLRLDELCPKCLAVYSAADDWHRHESKEATKEGGV